MTSTIRGLHVDKRRNAARSFNARCSVCSISKSRGSFQFALTALRQIASAGIQRQTTEYFEEDRLLRIVLKDLSRLEMSTCSRRGKLLHHSPLQTYPLFIPKFFLCERGQTGVLLVSNDGSSNYAQSH
mmetsp:Transcript_36165/g.144568  ORF Transcript_36165/g.144568 Transcript_36165/m.144568 type:complete len:128 (-) Transcript_36165:276-659(-)